MVTEHQDADLYVSDVRSQDGTFAKHKYREELLTMGRMKERSHFFQGDGNVIDMEVDLPFPMACINWHRGCNYKTPRGVPREELVLTMLEMHKSLCKKTDGPSSKKSASSPRGFLKPKIPNWKSDPGHENGDNSLNSFVSCEAKETKTEETHIEESSLGEEEDPGRVLMEANLLNNENLKRKLKTKALHIDELKLDIAQSGRLGWSPERLDREEENLELLQGQLCRWISKLQAPPPKVKVKASISRSLVEVAREDRDNFGNPNSEELVVPEEGIESKANRRHENGKTEGMDKFVGDGVVKEERISSWKHERNNELEAFKRGTFTSVQGEEFISHRKNFICRHCEKTFAKKGCLKRHLISHTGLKPFKCNQCDSSYRQQQDLKYHVFTNHTAGKSNLIRYTCEECESSFIRASEKKRHMMIHSGEKPFRCEFCGYTCGRINQLNTHVLIHGDTKPFMCNKCKYSSVQASNLKRHMNLHAETPFLVC